ncbi:MAG: uroporphyrinogen-III synthase [Kiritimatiellae bacterium]|nr:uroporphyrinogen-III synthase [Kiritimatiellia bacterium]
MGPRKIIVAARRSPLSQAQWTEAVSEMRPVWPPDAEPASLFLDSPGDRNTSLELGAPETPDDFFTRDIDEAVRDRRADIAVHSAKDLPRRMPDGLAVACLLPARDSRDAFVFRPGWDPSQISGARVGVSSPRRMEAATARWPGCAVRAIRGTIGDRIAQLYRGDYDVLIIAACALDRLGLSRIIQGYLPGPSAPLQGHLAIVARAAEPEWEERLRPLDFRRTLLDPPASDAAPSKVWIESENSIQALDGESPAWLFTGQRPEYFFRCRPMIWHPMLRMVPRPRAERVVAIERGLRDGDGVLFASPYAVRCAMDALFHGPGPRALAGKKLCAVGDSTAGELERMGFRADVTGRGFEGLASLPAATVDGARLWYPCSEAAPAGEREELMRSKGVTLAAQPMYSVEPHPRRPLPSAKFDRVLFTSPSGVAAYFEHYPEERSARRRWIAIGPPTREALRNLGLEGELFYDPR